MDYRIICTKAVAFLTNEQRDTIVAEVLSEVQASECVSSDAVVYGRADSGINVVVSATSRKILIMSTQEAIEAGFLPDAFDDDA